MPKNSNKNTYVYALGRRKSAIATVKLFSGKGESLVNKLPVEKYFPLSADKISYEKPFNVTDTFGKYHFQSKITGGGKNGQVEALTLAIARCLKKIDTAFTSSLRSANLLTVDSRVRQRRMVGTGGKSRRKKQSPKR